MSNLNFGKPVFSGSFDPALLEGSGVRPSDWQVGVSIQQQLMTGVAVEVGYFRRWLQHFTVIDNLAVTAADFDRFSIVAPADPRLPNGGGYTDLGSLQRQPGQVRPDEQLHHAGRQLRRRRRRCTTAS